MGTNNFIALATIPAGTAALPLPAVDLFTIVAPTGIEGHFTVICVGNFEGTIAIEGSLDGVNFNPVGEFTAGKRTEGSLPLEPSPITIPDVIRYLRPRIALGNILSDVFLTIGGAQNCDCAAGGPDELPYAILHVAKGGNDTTGNGSSSKPFLTVQKALDTIGSAASVVEYNDDLTSRWRVIVHPGVYTESLSWPTRQVIALELDTSKIVGTITYVMAGAVMTGTIQQTKLVITGNDLRNAYDLASQPMASALVGNILVSQSGGVGSLNFCQTHIINAGVRGNIRSTGAIAFTHQVFAENAILDAGDFIVDVGAGAGTLYCANSDTSSSHSWGGISGAIILNVLRNVRFTRPVVPTGGQSGRWFNVEFRSGQAHSFAGVTGGNFEADLNSFRSYFLNVPTKGAETFTILDKLSGTTAARPTAQLPVPANDGVPYFDTTLGFPIWRFAPGWVNSVGAAV